MKAYLLHDIDPILMKKGVNLQYVDVHTNANDVDFDTLMSIKGNDIG